MTHQRRVARISLNLVGLVMAISIGCHKPASQLTLKARFQSELDTLCEQYQFPGATAAYILQDGTVEVVAIGLADAESKIPMTTQSRMLAASIGKMFVGELKDEENNDDDFIIDNCNNCNCYIYRKNSSIQPTQKRSGKTFFSIW